MMIKSRIIKSECYRLKFYSNKKTNIYIFNNQNNIVSIPKSLSLFCLKPNRTTGQALEKSNLSNPKFNQGENIILKSLFFTF